MALFAGRGIGAQDPSTAKKPSSSSKRKTSKKKSTAKKPASSASHLSQAGKTAPKSTPKPQSKTAAASQTAHRRAPSKTTKRTQATSTARRSTQQQPTPERYKEIQQALAEKGYFNGPVDGQWGPESVDALKRFQREQNITDDGKIGSLSLIALGLGPKRTQTVEATPEKVQQ